MVISLELDFEEFTGVMRDSPRARPRLVMIKTMRFGGRIGYTLKQFWVLKLGTYGTIFTDTITVREEEYGSWWSPVMGPLILGVRDWKTEPCTGRLEQDGPSWLPFCTTDR